VSSGVGPVKMSHDEYTAKITDSIMRDFEVQATGVSIPSFRVPWYDKEEMEKNKKTFEETLLTMRVAVERIHKALTDVETKPITLEERVIIQDDLNMLYNMSSPLLELYESK
jgi:hypothetical protein